jgi:carbohydrate-selective porin OprB
MILNYSITDDWYLMAAAADAEAIGVQSGFESAFDGDAHVVYMTETGINTMMDSLPGVYRLGFWYDPRPKAYEGGPEKTDDHGFYLTCDQMILKESTEVNDTQGLGGFFRYGWAPEDKNDIAQVYSFGVQYQGLIDGRDNDVFGLGYANGIFSNKAKDTYPKDHESVFEAYYSMVITNWMTLSPSVQYIKNPGGTDTPDATIIGLRAQVTF